MSTRYTIKKCNSFGCAKTFEHAYESITAPLSEEENDSYIIHLTSDNLQQPSSEIHSTFTTLSALKKFIESPKFSELNSSHTLFKLIIDLGYMTTVSESIPVESDDSEIIRSFIPSFELSDEDRAEFAEYLIRLREDSNVFGDGKLSNNYINYIVELYPHLTDSVLKTNISSVLSSNNLNPKELEEKYPITYTSTTVERPVNTPIFSDIDISVRDDEKNTTNKMYRMDKEALKKAFAGNSATLDAFTANKFVVVHNHKDANIESNSVNQNHDVLDTLAINGVLITPLTDKPLSIYTLMKLLARMNHFDIIFIHPYSEINQIRVEYPCEQAIPAYRLHGGEIMAVAYRYLITHFFGYCSIFSDSMLEWRYYI